MADQPTTQEIITDEALSFAGIRPHAFSGLDDPTMVWYAMLTGGPTAIDYYEDLYEKDDKIGSSLDKRAEAVLACPSEILPASDRARDRRWQEFIIDCISNLPGWENLLRQLLTATGKGVAIAEILWDRQGSEIRPVRIKMRPQQLFNFGPPGWPQSGPLRFTSYRGGTGELMPPNKFIIHSFAMENEIRWGSPLIRKCFWLSWFKRQGSKFWAKFLEKGTGTIVTRYPDNATQEAKDIALRAAKALNEDISVALSETTKFEALEKARQGGTDSYEPFVLNFCDSGIAERILGGTLTSRGSDSGTGSRSTSQVHDEVRQEKKEADGKSLMECINDQLIDLIMLFNAGPGVPPPRWNLKYQPPADLNGLAERYERLVKIGVPVPVSHAQFTFGIPEAQPGEAMLKLAPTAATMAAGATGAAADGTSSGADGTVFDDGLPPDVADGVRDLIKLEDGAVKAAQELYAPLIKQAIDAATETVAGKKKALN
jgi:phage gp29-like protein